MQINYSSYQVIDGRRTVAANYSIVIGVRSSVTDTSIEYTNLDVYVEFYKNGKGKVY